MKTIILLSLFLLYGQIVFCQTVTAKTLQAPKKTDQIQIKNDLILQEKGIFNDTADFNGPLIIGNDTATHLTDFSLYDGVLGYSSAPMPMVYMDCHSNGHFNSCYITVTLTAGHGYTLPVTGGKTAYGSIFITGTNDFTSFGMGPDAAITLSGDNGTIGWATTLTTDKHLIRDAGTTATVTNNTSTTYTYHITINYVR
jgi:hypothetical protein